MASRHGQKGICSRLWSAVDMPWTESGMLPDLIFNPHGFPSRMTVGMMVEFVAGKAAMVNGRVYDSTNFVFDEDYPAEKHFGQILKDAGMNYHGMERMYSGTSGKELEGKNAQIDIKIRIDNLSMTKFVRKIRVCIFKTEANFQRIFSMGLFITSD